MRKHLSNQFVKRFKFIFLFVFFFFVKTSLPTGINLHKFQHFTGADELGTIRIDSIIQDSIGFLWIGTEYGLFRYDGYKFKELKIGSNEKTSLIFIDSLYKTKNNTILIGTLYDGFYILNLTNYTIIKKEIIVKGVKFSDKDIMAITEDKEGNIWLGSDNNGIVQLNSNYKVKNIFNTKSPINNLSNNHISELYTDSKGNIWIATSKGINFFDIKTKKLSVFKISFIKNNSIKHILEDSNSNIWIGTNKGLAILNKDNNNFKIFINKESDINSISNNYISELLEDKYGNIWIGTKDGINVLNPSSGIFKNYKTNDHIKTALGKDTFILSLFLDKSGIVWIGTESKGLYNYDFNNNQFGVFNKNFDKQNLKNIKNIRSIIEDDKEKIWIGNNAGLNMIEKNSKKNHLYKITKNSSNTYFPINSVSSILIDKSKNMWVSFVNHGLTKFNPIGGVFIKYNWVFDKLSKSINTLYEDSNGLIWIGTNNGLIKYNPKNTQKQYLKNINKNEYLLNKSVKTVYEDNSKTIWFGTLGGGLKYFDKNGKINTYKNIPSDPNSIGNNKILAINGDKKRNLYIGTYGDGLYIFNMDKKIFSNLGIKEGLLANTVYGILTDNKNNLWLSTNKGITKFNISNHSFQSFNMQDGIKNNQFNAGAFYKNKNGKLYFGGNRGLDFFNPKEIKLNISIPNIAITNFTKFDKNILSQDFFIKDNITLNYKDSFLFEFSALNFTNPNKNKYAYKIKEYHKNWIELGTNRSIIFNNLNPGEHELIIIGSNNDSVWNRKGKVIKLFIKPPFWMTQWFKFLTIIITLIIFSFLIFKFIRRKQDQILKNISLKQFFDFYKISNREQEIAIILSKGKTYKEIEEELFISYSTIKNHIYNIYKKIGIKNRGELKALIEKYNI